MKDALKLGLLGLGGWLAFSWLRGVGGAATAAPGGAVPAPGAAPAGNVPAPAQSPTPASTAAGPSLADRVRAAATATMNRQTATADEWNWFAAQAVGRALPPPEDFGFTGDGRFSPVAFDVWLARLRAAGLAASYGLAGLTGLGAGYWRWAR